MRAAVRMVVVAWAEVVPGAADKVVVARAVVESEAEARVAVARAREVKVVVEWAVVA